MKKNRTNYVIKNSTFGVINKVITMFLSFFVRTLFIQKLGAEYLGIEGLFSNVLSLLSLAELGVGNVLIFSLYKPISDGDKDKINSLLSFYRKVYFVIATFVFFVGLMMVPFLQYIVNSTFSNSNIILFYFFYLSNSVISYIAVCYTTLIKAAQEQYVIDLISTVIRLLSFICQLVILLFFSSFIGYLIIMILSTLCQNLLTSFIAKKKYSISKEASKLSKDEKNKIFSSVKSTFLYKIGVVVLNATDNILISIFVGTVFVGYFSNYMLIVNQVNSVVAILCTALIASIGNLSVQNDLILSNKIFNRLLFFFHSFSALFFIGFSLVFNDFINLWIGSSNVLSFIIPFSIAFNFYIQNIINPVWMYREAYGLFKEIKYLMLVTSFLNIIFSIIFGKLFGIAGVVLATAISRLLTVVWYEPKVLYNKIFKTNAFSYFLLQGKYCLCTLIAFALSFLICFKITISNLVLSILIKCFVICLVTFFIFVIFNYRSDEFKYWTSFLKKRFFRK